MFKKTVVAGAVAAALGSGLAQAQQPAAPASPHTLTGNVGLYSQYIFRGLTQTNGDPALQGGFDYATRAASTPAPGPRTSAGCATAARYYAAAAACELDFYGG